MDLFTYGVFLTCTQAVIIHAIIAVFVRDWGPFLICIFLISIVQLPLACYANDTTVSSYLYKVVYS